MHSNTYIFTRLELVAQKKVQEIKVLDQIVAGLQHLADDGYDSSDSESSCSYGIDADAVEKILHYISLRGCTTTIE